MEHQSHRPEVEHLLPCPGRHCTGTHNPAECQPKPDPRIIRHRGDR